MSEDEGRPLGERVARLEAQVQMFADLPAKIDAVAAGVRSIERTLDTQAGSRRVHSGFMAWIGAAVVAITGAAIGVILTHVWR